MNYKNPSWAFDGDGHVDSLIPGFTGYHFPVSFMDGREARHTLNHLYEKIFIDVGHLYDLVNLFGLRELHGPFIDAINKYGCYFEGWSTWEPPQSEKFTDFKVYSDQEFMDLAFVEKPLNRIRFLADKVDKKVCLQKLEALVKELEMMD